MRFRLNEQSIGWLYAKRILFQGFRRNGFRLKPGDTLQVFNHMEIEPYCSIFSGNQLCRMGSFSYTWSPLPLDFSVGRYCSIAWNIKFPGPRHPHHLLSTSMFIVGAQDDIWTTYLEDTNQSFGNRQPSPQKGGTVIGNDVWIGQDASIMRGLTIGDRLRHRRRSRRHQGRATIRDRWR